MTATPRVVLLMVPFAGYDRGLLEGIARYNRHHRPWVFYLSGDHPEVPLPASDSVSGEFTARGYVSDVMRANPLPSLRQWGATGVIGRIPTARVARKILSAKLPVIGIDLSQSQLAPPSALAGIAEIRADSRQAGRLAAEHFLERGFRHFAFCGYAGRTWSDQRQHSYGERLQAAGFACQVYEPPPQRRSLSWRREQRLVSAWLRSLPKPIAVMACNDIRGRQLLEAAFLAQLTVPDSVAIVGVDDDGLICNLSNPPLSSVAFNLERAGYEAAELLDAMMRGERPPPRRVPVEATHVVCRRSTDVIATDDQPVATALRFIRDHGKEPINVADVVAEVGISRRGLEIRFRHAMGHSIRCEIQRMRVGYVKQLLLETALPAQRIAALAGFSCLPYLSNVFRQEAGMTLGQFRRRMRTP